MSEPITTQEANLIRCIRERGGKLWDDLSAKCRWEQMSPVLVLREWPSLRRRCKSAMTRIKRKK